MLRALERRWCVFGISPWNVPGGSDHNDKENGLGERGASREDTEKA